MTQSKVRKGTRTPAAIVVAAFIVAAGILLASSPYGLGGARTVTSTKTITSAATSMTAIQLHRVTFNETTCMNDYADEWAVTLGNITISQPANATFPFSGPVSFSPAGMAISKIVFTMPDGAYDYNVSKGIAPYVQTGKVNVNGSDVIVQVNDDPLSCGLGGGQG
jgi:hypothetical protein